MRTRRAWSAGRGEGSGERQGARAASGARGVTGVVCCCAIRVSIWAEDVMERALSIAPASTMALCMQRARGVVARQAFEACL
ncbi:hypothetical protein FGB62_12g353 [Gracilaria domingensis]|nr:hypothetical protein FGB62_12g353 [Gracilaria domingensis]